jgi:nucleoside-diphosphate-sugar epimerase
MRVLVAGAAGVIGMPVVRLLTAAGHDVVAVARSSARLGRLADAGAEPVACDALDAAALEKVVGSAQPEVVVNQLTAFPRRIRPRQAGRDLAASNRLRSQGTRNLMAAARTAGVAHAVAQSVAFAYAPDAVQPASPGHDGLRRERDPLYHAAPGAFAQAVAAITDLESETLEGAGIPAAVLRYGFFYGPGTSYAADGSIAADVRRRRFPVIGGGSGTFCFIHVDDAARATLAAIEQRAEGIYNIVDDEPAPVAEWLPVYAAALGAPPPRRLPRWLGRVFGGPYAMYLMTQMPGASNDHVKAALGWRPLRPSWRGGFRDDLAGRE